MQLSSACHSSAHLGVPPPRLLLLPPPTSSTAAESMLALGCGCTALLALWAEGPCSNVTVPDCAYSSLLLLLLLNVASLTAAPAASVPRFGESCGSWPSDSSDACCCCLPSVPFMTATTPSPPSPPAAPLLPGSGSFCRALPVGGSSFTTWYALRVAERGVRAAVGWAATAAICLTSCQQHARSATGVSRPRLLSVSSRLLDPAALSMELPVAQIATTSSTARPAQRPCSTTTRAQREATRFFDAARHLSAASNTCPQFISANQPCEAAGCAAAVRLLAACLLQQVYPTPQHPAPVLAKTLSRDCHSLGFSLLN